MTFTDFLNQTTPTGVRMFSNIWFDELDAEILNMGAVFPPGAKDVLSVICQTETYMKCLPDMDAADMAEIIHVAAKQCALHVANAK